MKPSEFCRPWRETHTFQNQLPAHYNHPPLQMLPLKNSYSREMYGADDPPETNEFYGPLTSHVGELHSATGASVLAGNPHCGSSSLWG